MPARLRYSALAVAASERRRPPEEEERAVALPSQGIVARGENQLEWFAHERCLGLRTRPAHRIRAARAREELTRGGFATWILERWRAS